METETEPMRAPDSAPLQASARAIAPAKSASDELAIVMAQYGAAAAEFGTDSVQARALLLKATTGFKVKAYAEPDYRIVCAIEADGKHYGLGLNADSSRLQVRCNKTGIAHAASVSIPLTTEVKNALRALV